MNAERLLNVAKALRESPDPDKFTMLHVHTCGTPACALGHYAARRDLQEMFQLSPTTEVGVLTIGVWGATRSTHGWLTFVAHHFGITDDQAYLLFGGFGCNAAQTPNAAARYIENFVARHAEASQS
jgi:hypothetical protein